MLEYALIIRIYDKYDKIAHKAGESFAVFVQCLSSESGGNGIYW